MLCLAICQRQYAKIAICANFLTFLCFCEKIKNFFK